MWADSPCEDRHRFSIEIVVNRVLKFRLAIAALHDVNGIRPTDSMDSVAIAARAADRLALFVKHSWPSSC